MPDKESKYLTPPVWNTEATTYEDWKFDVQLWIEFTKVEKARQGFALYSSLPTARGVHDKVRLAMQNEEIKISEENSVTQIFTILDKWYKKDDLSVVCEAWCSFKNLTKQKTVPWINFLTIMKRR